MGILAYFFSCVLLCGTYVPHKTKNRQQESNIPSQLELTCRKREAAWGKEINGLQLGIYTECDKEGAQFTTLVTVLKNVSAEVKEVAELDNGTVIFHMYGVSVAAQPARIPRKLKLNPGESSEYRYREDLRAMRAYAESEGRIEIEDVKESIWAEYGGLRSGNLGVEARSR